MQRNDSFTAGQHVVWRYRPQRRGERACLIAAEVIQAGQLRVRIRVKTTRGAHVLRWVKPENLRPMDPSAPVGLYPECEDG